jgi:hypothetical protein
MKKIFFHVTTLDSDMGSLGIISGSSNDELNTSLRKALHSAFDAEALSFKEVDFSFWESEHTEQVEVTCVDGQYDDEGATYESEQHTVELTYTWLV